VILREATMPQLMARRDELRAQVAAIDAEIARRTREWMEEQNRARAQYLAEHASSRPSASLLPTFGGAFGHRGA
jgi:hypothetical protein